MSQGSPAMPCIRKSEPLDWLGREEPRWGGVTGHCDSEATHKWGLGVGRWVLGYLKEAPMMC